MNTSPHDDAAPDLEPYRSDLKLVADMPLSPQLKIKEEASEQSEYARVLRLDAILTDTMHEAVVKFATLNNRLFVLSLCCLDSLPVSSQHNIGNESIDMRCAVASQGESVRE